MIDTRTGHDTDTCDTCARGGGSIDKYHCFFHGYEPIVGWPYLVCCECGHAYQTGDDLVEEDRAAYYRCSDSPRWNSAVDQGWASKEPVPRRLPGEVTICPLCTHDL